MHQFLIRLLGPAAIVTATFGLVAPAAAKIQFISCAAPFKADTSHKSLAQSFGKFVAEGEIDVPEEGKVKGTVLYPGNAARRIEIIWADKRGRSRPYSVTYGPGWRTQDGVRVGMTLEDLEKLNGRPFKLSGFDWDYGGTVTDWNGGKLNQRVGKCRLVVRFGISYDLPLATHNAVSGDQDFSSQDRRMRAAKPEVREIALIFE